MFCIPAPRRHYGADVYLERVGKTIVATVDTFSHCGLDAIVYDPSKSKKVGAANSTKSYLPKGAPGFCTPTVINVWETGNVDALTDLIVNRMVAALGPITQTVCTKDGFLKLIPNSKKIERLHRPMICVCGTEDSELNAVASICQVLVEGCDLRHDVVTALNYETYLMTTYNEHAHNFVDALVDVMGYDHEVSEYVKTMLYKKMIGMYVVPTKNNEAWL